MSAANFRCELAASARPLVHVWEHTVGSCHAPLALRADWQGQLRRCRRDLGFRHVRFHGLLGDDMSTVVARARRPVYSFFNADQVVDFLLSIGMRPFVELSFMPSALASGTKTVFHYRGNVTPPRDYGEWANLIRTLAAHWVARYGLDEVRRWYFEVWNEPNLVNFWSGNQCDYLELYRRTALALKEVDGALRVGGPATANNEWIDDFLDFCERRRVPCDFVSTHNYPNDALWAEHQDTESQLAGAPRNVLVDWARRVRQCSRDLPLYYTEWNVSSNLRYPPQDESYAAAFIVRTLMEVSSLVDCYSFWTFSDIFEEDYSPSVPFHGGFGLLNLQGVPKPNCRAFELLHRLGDAALPVEGQHPTVDAWVVRQERGLTVLLTNQAMPRQPIATETVHVELVGAPAPVSAWVERIDADHANPKRAWLEMGAPEYPSPREVERLHEAARLVQDPQAWEQGADGVHLDVTLPPQSVAAITLEWPAPITGGIRA